MIYNILDFGAVSDGKKICTSAIQKAIDCCDISDIVFVPKGKYISGAIFLQSNMTLMIEKGAIIKGSTNVEDYPLIKYRFEGEEQICYASLINTKEGKHRNICICGGGEIDASGEILCRLEMNYNAGKRGRAMCVRNTSNVLIKNISISQSPAWCLHLIYCDNVDIHNISVNTKYNSQGEPYKNITNGDGIDIDSCKNVYISSVVISSQDDCIAIKSGKNEEGRKVAIPSENIIIDNCVFNSGAGIAMGSEMSGGIYNVLVKNCSFKNVLSIVSIKTQRGRGGVLKNVKFRNCSLKNDIEMKVNKFNYKGVIYIDSFYKSVSDDKESIEKINEKTPIIKDISLSNITIDSIYGMAFYVVGLPESPIDFIEMTDVRILCEKEPFLKNVLNIKLNNVLIGKT